MISMHTGCIEIIIIDLNMNIKSLTVCSLPENQSCDGSLRKPDQKSNRPLKLESHFISRQYCKLQENSSRFLARQVQSSSVSRYRASIILFLTARKICALINLLLIMVLVIISKLIPANQFGSISSIMGI